MNKILHFRCTLYVYAVFWINCVWKARLRYFYEWTLQNKINKLKAVQVIRLMQPKWSFTFTNTPDFNLALLLGASALASRLWRACFWCFCNIYRSNSASVRNTSRELFLIPLLLCKYIFRRTTRYIYFNTVRLDGSDLNIIRKTNIVRGNGVTKRHQASFLASLGLSS